MKKKNIFRYCADAGYYDHCYTLQPHSGCFGKYTGTYTKTWSVSSNMSVTIKPSYSVIVNKVTSTKVRLQLEKLGVNGSPIYATAPLQRKRKET